VETPFNRPIRNDENVVKKEMYIFNSSRRKLGKVEILELDGKSLAQAHRYAFLNHSKIKPFRSYGEVYHADWNVTVSLGYLIIIT
ncbi:hypothetical protein Tco_1356936, partial [Tanacetum coccineum]